MGIGSWVKSYLGSVKKKEEERMGRDGGDILRLLEGSLARPVAIEEPIVCVVTRLTLNTPTGQPGFGFS